MTNYPDLPLEFQPWFWALLLVCARLSAEAQP